MNLTILDPRETACYSWHGTKSVTLTWDAPLSRAQSPGLSVSNIEPLGVCLSRFWLSSSRSLGRCLLLGQRSRFNLFSNFVGSLLHQYHRNPDTEFSRHCNNGDSGSYIARMGAANRAKEFPQLAVLADGRPGTLDELTSQPWVPVWVIDPRSVLSPVEFSVGTKPRKPASWRMLLSSRQSPMRARS